MICHVGCITINVYWPCDGENDHKQIKSSDSWWMLDQNIICDTFKLKLGPYEIVNTKLEPM